MKYYKMLERNSEGQLVSALANQEEWRVAYLEPKDEKQKWARPQVAGSKLFVYTDLAFAYWCASYRKKELWRVKVRGIEPLDCVVPAWRSSARWQCFWESPATFEGGCHYPRHTVLVDRVLLVERVEVGADK